MPHKAAAPQEQLPADAPKIKLRVPQTEEAEATIKIPKPAEITAHTAAGPKPAPQPPPMAMPVQQGATKAPAPPPPATIARKSSEKVLSPLPGAGGKANRLDSALAMLVAAVTITGLVRVYMML